MDNICICSNKNPPEYWTVSLIPFAGWFSGMQTVMEISVEMFIRGALGINTCVIRREEMG